MTGAGGWLTAGGARLPMVAKRVVRSCCIFSIAFLFSFCSCLSPAIVSCCTEKEVLSPERSAGVGVKFSCGTSEDLMEVAPTFPEVST